MSAGPATGLTRRRKIAVQDRPALSRLTVKQMRSANKQKSCWLTGNRPRSVLHRGAHALNFSRSVAFRPVSQSVDVPKKKKAALASHQPLATQEGRDSPCICYVLGPAPSGPAGQMRRRLDVVDGGCLLLTSHSVPAPTTTLSRVRDSPLQTCPLPPLARDKDRIVAGEAETRSLRSAVCGLRCMPHALSMQ